MKNRLKILLGNDDSIDADGIKILAKELSSFADIYISAPKNHKSGFSHNLSCNFPLYFGEKQIDGATKAWYVDDGTPVDAMKIGLDVFMKDNTPDLVISGINDGPNLGTDVYYSGTVAAGFEGIFYGIPSIAVSCNNWHNTSNQTKLTNFYNTAKFVSTFVKWWSARNFKPKTFFNINTPSDFKEINKTKIAFTTIGTRDYDNVFEKFTDEKGETYYKILGTPNDSKAQKNSDVDYINRGFVTISPIGLDTTDYQILQEVSLINSNEFYDCEK